MVDNNKDRRDAKLESKALYLLAMKTVAYDDSLNVGMLRELFPESSLEVVRMIFANIL